MNKSFESHTLASGQEIYLPATVNNPESTPWSSDINHQELLGQSEVIGTDGLGSIRQPEDLQELEVQKKAEVSDKRYGEMLSASNILYLKEKYDVEVSKLENETTFSIDSRHDKDSTKSSTLNDSKAALKAKLINDYTRIGLDEDTEQDVDPIVLSDIAKLMDMSYEELEKKELFESTDPDQEELDDYEFDLNNLNSELYLLAKAHKEAGNTLTSFFINEDGTPSDSHKEYSSKIDEILSTATSPRVRQLVIEKANAMLNEAVADLRDPAKKPASKPVTKKPASKPNKKVVAKTPEQIEEEKKIELQKALDKGSEWNSVYKEQLSKSGDKLTADQTVTNLVLSEVKTEATKYRKNKSAEDNEPYLETPEGKVLLRGYTHFLDTKNTREDDYFKNLSEDEKNRVLADDEKSKKKEVEQFKLIARRADNGMRIGNVARAVSSKLKRQK